MIKYLFVVIILMNSCSIEHASKTVYSYNGVTITRIDNDRVSYFYYRNNLGNEPDTTIPHIIADYPLGSQTMEGYLLFKKTKKVTLVTITSNFVQKGLDSQFTIFDFKSNIDFINWADSIEKKFDNLIRISESFEIEDRLNKQFGSKVHVERFNSKRIQLH